MESDKRKVEIVRDTYPKWERSWLKDDNMVEEHTKSLVQSIKQHLNEFHGDWGGIKHGILPWRYSEWLEKKGIRL